MPITNADRSKSDDTELSVPTLTLLRNLTKDTDGVQSNPDVPDQALGVIQKKLSYDSNEYILTNNLNKEALSISET